MYKVIAKLNLSSEGDASGIECRFFKVGEVGIKVYATREAAYGAAKSQQLGFERGIGPKVFEFGMVKNLDGSGHCWGYSTELAIPLFTEMASPLFREIVEQSKPYRGLMDQLDEIGITQHDMHHCNVAVMTTEKWSDGCPRQSKLVCIDFGSDSRRDGSSVQELRKTPTCRKSGSR